jgi:hypothetical protein
MKKKCIKCEISKDVSCFSKDKRNKLYAYCKDCGNEVSRNYYNAHKENIAVRRKKWGDNNLSRLASIARKYRKIHADRQAARNAVNDAVIRGVIVAPKHLICSNCKKQAQEYHHYKGYKREHWLDVIPLCRDCHKD